MLVEHSVAESAQRLACLADSCSDFFVQGAIAGNGASKILEMFNIDKWCVINDCVGWSIFVLPRLTARPKSLEALGKRSGINCPLVLILG